MNCRHVREGRAVAAFQAVEDDVLGGRVARVADPERVRARRQRREQVERRLYCGAVRDGGHRRVGGGDVRVSWYVEPCQMSLIGIVDFDKGVGIGGLSGGPRIAGVGLDAQRAELDGLGHILIEIDDAPGDLVEPGKGRLLVDDLLAGGSETTSSPGCSVAGVCGTLLGLALSRRLICRGLQRRGRDALVGLRGRHRDAGWRFCGITVVPGGGASGCDCTAPGGVALARRRTLGSAKAGRAAIPVLLLRPRARLRCCATGNAARAAAAPGIGKNIADLRTRGRRKRDGRSGQRAAKPVSGRARNILARILRDELGVRH